MSCGWHVLLLVVAIVFIQSRGGPQMSKIAYLKQRAFIATQRKVTYKMSCQMWPRRVGKHIWDVGYFDFGHQWLALGFARRGGLAPQAFVEMRKNHRCTRTTAEAWRAWHFFVGCQHAWGLKDNDHAISMQVMQGCFCNVCLMLRNMLII